ncbi:MAG: exodeoxyribonuclease VII large subunit [Bacteroidetes bacterium]|nr:exodeoxyribonuclease VII large subunit [Bacteroidota bacterium]
MEIRTHIKLSDLTRQVEDVIKGAFNSTYWIIAEIEGHKFYPNDDRHYFDFIEKSDVATEQIAKVSGVSWRDGSRTIKALKKKQASYLVMAYRC